MTGFPVSVPAVTLIYMTTSRIEQNDTAVTDALAAGKRLHIGVTLSFVGGSSDKFWTGVWAGNRIAVNWGRHGAEGQFTLHDGLTEREGAKKFWDLLRSKVGKGYAVADASVLIVPHADLNTHPAFADRDMVRCWMGLRTARAAKIRPSDHPETHGISPRTPTEGAQVLLDVTSPDASPGVLSAAAVVGPTERFLPPIVVSRPDLPYEVKFMAALSGNAKVFV